MKLFKKTPKHMGDINFFMCMSKSRNIDSGAETVFIKGTQGPYEVNFYGHLIDNYELTVEDFGCWKKSKWIQMEPTEMQLKVMKDQLLKHVDIAYAAHAEKMEQAMEGARHETDMQATYDFINTNFLNY